MNTVINAIFRAITYDIYRFLKKKFFTTKRRYQR